MLARLGLIDYHSSSVELVLVSTVFCLALVSWLSALAFMVTVPFSGDEFFYTRNASALADYWISSEISSQQLARRLVQSGWFMPGMSFLLAPLYLVDSTPHLGFVRVYTAVLIFMLWIWTLREISALIGRVTAVILLVFPTLAAVWLLFTCTAWGDLPAGLALAIVCARSYRLATRVFEDMPIGIGEVISLELIMIGMVYLRGSTVLAVIAVHIFLPAIWALSGRLAFFLRQVGKLVIGATIFLLLLAPWSLTASRVLGGPVLTTSIIPFSVGITFGREICFGPCPGGHGAGSALRFSRQYAKQHAIDELEAQRCMAAYALRDLTFDSYMKRVRGNFQRFLTRPGGFIDRFVSISQLEFESVVAQRIISIGEKLTSAVYYPFLIGLVLANVIVITQSIRKQILSLSVKMLTLVLFVQPFVHESHSRYWPTFAPLAGIAVGFLLNWWADGRHTRASGSKDVDPFVPRRILTILQVGYVFTVLTIGLALGISS